MHAFKYQIEVPTDHQITLPDEVPSGPAELQVVMVRDDSPHRESLTSFLATLNPASSTCRTRESIDAELTQERSSWEC